MGALVDETIGAVTRRYGLSHAALNALAVIEGAGGPLLSGEVGARMHITSGSVTSLLDNLEKKGFVERRGDPLDRRRVLVDITTSAQAVLDELLPEIQQASRQITGRLSGQQHEDLIAILALIREGIASMPADLPRPGPRRRPTEITR